VSIFCLIIFIYLSIGWLTKELALDSWQGQDIFPFSTASRSALEQVEAFIQWSLVGSVPGVK
jgi:hypothetical protein